MPTSGYIKKKEKKLPGINYTGPNGYACGKFLWTRTFYGVFVVPVIVLIEFLSMCVEKIIKIKQFNVLFILP